METREEILEKLSFSEKQFNKMVGLLNEEKAKKGKVEEIEERIERYKSSLDAANVGIYWYVLIAVVGAIFTIIVHSIAKIVAKFIDFITEGIFDGFKPGVFTGVLTAIAVIIVVGFIIYQIYYYKNERETMPGLIELEEKDLLKAQGILAEVTSKLVDFKNSEDWKNAVRYIPEDYFYPKAIDKLKYYIRNGHADSIKEALHLYDEFLHREKMEYEAARAADEARRAADSAEMTAIATAEATEYAKITAEQAERIEYWTAINALTNIEINSKLN